MDCALVTGITGFTGRYVAAELRRSGLKVVGIGRGGSVKHARVISCDLLDEEMLWSIVSEAAPRYIVHLAAIANVAHADVEQIYRVNIVGTRNLLEALTRLPQAPEKVILASSANVYGNTSVDPITEDVRPQPENDYGVSKCAMEQVARIWTKHLPIAIVRPFNYTGVGQSKDFLLPKMVEAFARKQSHIELGNIDVARDFCDVRDVARAYVLLLAGCPAGEVVNICSGAAVTIQRVLELLEEISGHHVTPRVNPGLVRSNEIKTLRGSNSRLKRVLSGLNFIPLRDTLAWMYGHAVDRADLAADS